jgi:hypothetical protein
MAGLTESYCRSNETSHASQFKWLDNTLKGSVGNRCHFGAYPDPRISTFDKWIRIRIQLQIRLLSSVTLRMKKKIIVFLQIFCL